MPIHVRTAAAVLTVVSFAAAWPDARIQSQEQATCARTWVGREPEIEAYLKTAKVAKMTETPVGVTKPSKALLEPGGPVAAMAWKPLAPRMRGGYWESYKSEIAAYQLDKLLQLEMVPPKVERTLRGDVGVAVMWASPAASFRERGGVPPPPSGQIPQWTRQLVRAKMFDNLIANIDPNLGNWLVDPDGHIILIDHSRAFTTTKRLVHELNNVDQALWERMQALDEAALTTALGGWIGKHEIRAILERRERLGKAIGRLIASKGQSVVMR
ncbi:MAG TPA: hypothetical protein VG106_15395 [Vicinamibacterales bacterium]|nr:hypothetical protein [Vicinamibacterales bacterium]